MTDDTVYDDDGNQVAPGGRRLAEEIVSHFSDAGFSPLRQDPLECYGRGFVPGSMEWAFTTSSTPWMGRHS
jgi:hypothetical protein